MAKSVVDIDVNGSQFDTFQAAFKKYQDALGKLPGAWNAQGAAASKSAQAIKDGAASMLAQQEILRKINLEHEKFARTSTTAANAFSKTERSAENIARHVKSTVASILKWSTITGAVGGLAGFGGLWGIDRMAANAGADRRTSQGLGVTTGARRAFDINYGKFFNPESVLSNIANAQNDQSDWWVLNSLGGRNFRNKSATQLAPDMAIQAKRIFEQGGETQQYAEARGLLKIFTMDDLRRLHQMTEQEIRDAQKKYESDAKTLDLSDRTQRNWQTLGIQLERSKTQIENALIKGLEGLTPNLTHLSDAVTKALAAFLRSPVAVSLIDDLSAGIEGLATWMGKPEFKQDMKEFEANIGKAVVALKSFYHWIFPQSADASGSSSDGSAASGPDASVKVPEAPTWAPDKDAKYSGGVPQFDKRGLPIEPGLMRPIWNLAKNPDWPTYDANLQKFKEVHQAELDRLSGLEKKYGLPDRLLTNVWAKESGSGRDPTKLARNQAGAIGDFQTTPDIEKEYDIKNPLDFNDQSEGVARNYQDYLGIGDSKRAAYYRKQFGGDLAKAAASYNRGPGNVMKAVKENGEKWQEHLPKETKDYIAYIIAQTGESRPAGASTVHVVIENRTGADVTTTATSAAASVRN